MTRFRVGKPIRVCPSQVGTCWDYSFGMLWPYGQGQGGPVASFDQDIFGIALELYFSEAGWPAFKRSKELSEHWTSLLKSRFKCRNSPAGLKFCCDWGSNSIPSSHKTLEWSSFVVEKLIGWLPNQQAGAAALACWYAWYPGIRNCKNNWWCMFCRGVLMDDSLIVCRFWGFFDGIWCLLERVSGFLDGCFPLIDFKVTFCGARTTVSRLLAFLGCGGPVRIGLVLAIEIWFLEIEENPPIIWTYKIRNWPLKHHESDCRVTLMLFDLHWGMVLHLVPSDGGNRCDETGSHCTGQSLGNRRCMHEVTDASLLANTYTHVVWIKR